MRGSSAWAMRRRGHASRNGSSPRKAATSVIAGLSAKAFRSAHPRRCAFSRALHAHRQCDLPASDRRRQVDAQARHPTRDRQDAGLGRESLYKALAPGASRVMTPSSSSRVRWECVCMRNRDNCTRRRALRCHGEALDTTRHPGERRNPVARDADPAVEPCERNGRAEPGAAPAFVATPAAGFAEGAHAAA